MLALGQFVAWPFVAYSWSQVSSLQLYWLINYIMFVTCNWLQNLKTSVIVHWYEILILSKENSFSLAFSLFSSFVRKICFDMNEDEISSWLIWSNLWAPKQELVAFQKTFFTVTVNSVEERKRDFGRRNSFICVLEKENYIVHK